MTKTKGIVSRDSLTTPEANVNINKRKAIHPYQAAVQFDGEASTQREPLDD